MSDTSQASERAFRQRKQLADDANRLNGHFESLVEDKARCILAIEDSNKFLEHKEAVHAVLKALHSESVEQTRVLYEDVLTGLLQDIFPNDPENSRVHLNLGVKRSQAALSVEVSNDKGHRRDVFLDKGGSVKSIIAIGLRFIALSRSSRRRLVVLDEADSELNPLFIPRFAKMMSQLAAKIGMQVIYVSHHDHREFEGHARIIRLSRKEGRVSADVISDNASTEVSGWEGEKNIGLLMDGVGLTDIRLVNVKQHENTILELSPLVNVIAGTNDVGKSTVIQAIECVARNKGREGLIRDDQDKLRIEIGLEGSQRIIYQYKRRGSRKTKYSFFNHRNEKVEESRDGISCPEWVHAHLGMKLHKQHDLNIGTQQSPNFVLDPNVSEHKRAEVLSLNKLSGASQRMIEEHNRLVDAHKKEVARSKKDLARVNQKLRELSMIHEVVDSLPDLEAEEEALRARSLKIAGLKEIGLRWAGLESNREALGSIKDIPGADPDFIENIDRIGGMQRLLTQWSGLEEKRKILSDSLSDLGAEISPPGEGSGIKEMVSIGLTWSGLLKRRELIDSALKEMDAMVVNPVEDLQDVSGEVLSTLERLLGQKRELQKSLSDGRARANLTKSQLDSLIGQSCGACGQPISEDHIHA